MADENLLTERDGAVLIITINRPAVLNALNTPTMEELDRVMSAAQADESVRVLVITGSGEKSFIAGADINELAVLTPAQGKEHARFGQQIFDRIEQLGKPVIAALNGFALGGGCELAMACTLRLAADIARLGQPEINLGIIPGYAGSQRLPRLVGRGRALEILLTGDMIPAQRAYEIGLVNRVARQATAVLQRVPAPGLLDEDAAHGLGDRGEEVAAAVPAVLRFVPGHAQERLVDQGRGLERLARRLAGQPRGGEPAEVVVDERQELGGCGRVVGRDRIE